MRRGKKFGFLAKIFTSQPMTVTNETYCYMTFVNITIIFNKNLVRLFYSISVPSATLVGRPHVWAVFHYDFPF